MNRIDWLTFFNREQEMALDAGDRLAQVLRPRRISSVLDAVAGIGMRALSLARAGFDVVACEGDAELFARAGRKLAEYDAHVPLYRLGLRGTREVAEAPFDAILVLDDAIARWPHEQHGAILRGVGEQLVPAGYLVIGLRNWERQLRSRDNFVPRQVTRMNGSRLLMFDVWEYTTSGAGTVTVTTFYLYTHGGQWRVTTAERNYYPIRGNELQAVVEAAGYTLIELIEHPNEKWWIVRKEN